MKDRNETAIAVKELTGDHVTFTVTRSAVVTGQVFYVRNTCFDKDGNKVTSDISLVYFDPASAGNATGTTNPLPVAGVRGEAFVTDKTSATKATSGECIAYEVAA